MAALTCTATFPALRIAGGARCVCVLSTVYRTFRSRRRPRTPNLAAITTSARPAIAEGSQDFRTQLRRLLPLPYRVDGDPVQHTAENTTTETRYQRALAEWLAAQEHYDPAEVTEVELAVHQGGYCETCEYTALGVRFKLRGWDMDDELPYGWTLPTILEWCATWLAVPLPPQ